MITIHIIRETMGRIERKGPFPRAWEGATLDEMAPEEAIGCIYNKQVIKKTDPEWGMIPDDGAILCYVETDQAYAAAGAIVAYLFGAAFAATAAGVLVTAIVAIAISFAISSAANFALNSLLAPSANGLPETNAGRSKTSPTYGFDNIQLTVQNGTVIQVVYGEHLVGGQLIQTERKIEGHPGDGGGHGGGVDDDGDSHSGTIAQSENLYMLIVLSQGPIGMIGDPEGVNYTTDQNGLKGAAIPNGIFLNGVEARTFNQIEVSLRMGALTQTVIPGFDDIVNEYPQEGRELSGDSVFEWDCRVPVSSVEARLVFPRGIYKTTATGGLEVLGNPPAVAMEIRRMISGELIVREEAIYSAATTAVLFGVLRVDGLEPDRYHVIVKRISGRPAYENGGDKVYEDHMNISAIKEIQHAAPSYNGCALLAIKVHATTQLSGAPPNITTIIRGRKLEPITAGVWDTTEVWSDNPAYVLGDVLTQPRYGLGKIIFNENLSPVGEWEDYKEWCEEVIPAFSGAASSYGQPVPDAGNGSSASIDPVVTGTYA